MAETDVQVTPEMENIISFIEKMTVLELSNLVKALEDRLGVTAAAPVAISAVAGAAGGEGESKVEEEKTEFNVVLTGYGEKKIQVIKEVRTITGLNLKDAKSLVESTPKPVKEGVSKDEAEQIKEKLEAVGAGVELK